MIQESLYTDPMLLTQHIITWRNELPSCHSAITDFDSFAERKECLPTKGGINLP
jgi:hypothetical protein